MKSVYIDHNIIVAFFLQDHPLHKQTIGDIALFLKQRDNYFCSLNAIYEAINKLNSSLYRIKNSALLPANIEVEKEVVSKITNLIKRVGIKIIHINNQNIFSHALSLQLEFKAPFNNAFYTAILQEQKIKYIATYDEGYNKLFSEGVLIKYQPHRIPPG
ncbi:hypothetical protein A2954_07555 [Candidatus Roizmanbacteria bacterium RIFCSPLOWO2_01_FULL_37_12]|uniref:Uncharacterized protein n=1 Tax=Candidatus Roizmanbacteria bacterium RIFCSPLOWO2_01_FULL_37_12 TaxID=1802056 RepID=A0A1F7IEC1_9BACT|nr:MAG: hypothetical protein A3D76_05565 [Candidatus Roizmanbacteria bacterium RIFCSPHIGHO2_02_FULL_37_9b]OGK41705.1 MAG: hypothetical protein A2954_07555 [Candidatus Roizmanbacteria bacterium RIFCSPLOWO2_01_FULL_37_12]